MKRLLLILTIVLAFAGIAKAQLASGAYGPYTFVANYDRNGNQLDVTGFNQIKLHVITTSFYGITQSSVFYSYNFMGQPQTSGSFNYQGISNGWFVYSFYGQELVVSSDGSTVRTTNPYGGYAEYELN